MQAKRDNFLFLGDPAETEILPQCAYLVVEPLEGNMKIIVTTLVILILGICIFFSIYYFKYLRPRKSRFNQNIDMTTFYTLNKRNTTEKYDPEEIYSLIINNNNENITNDPIKIEDFEAYLMKNLENDSDDNEITRQFRVLLNFFKNKNNFTLILGS